MDKAKWLYLLVLALLLSAWGRAAVAEEATQPQPAAPEKSKTTPQEEEWLNTVWTQVDELVKQEDFKRQATVTVAGVRGAEAEDNILDKLYYKGGKRYPSQDKLKKAIETLKQSIAQNPKAESVPKQIYFIAQCYEKLGQSDEAKNYYAQVVKEHPKSSWATKSQERLTQLAQAE